MLEYRGENQEKALIREDPMIFVFGFLSVYPYLIQYFA